MKKICVTCGLEKFIISADGMCSGCKMNQVAARPRSANAEVAEEFRVAKEDKYETVVIDTTPKQPLKCDGQGCNKEFKSVADYHKLRGLNLCSSCYTSEFNLLRESKSTEIPPFDPKDYKTWPRCVSCNAHTKEPIDGKCTSCSKKPVKIEPLKFSPTDSNKYQEFFNAETESLTDKLKQFETEQDGIAWLREDIIRISQELFSLDAELLHKKTQKQAKLVKFNAILSKMSMEEQNKFKLKDSSYVVDAAPKKALANPLKQQAKKAKAKSSLDEQIQMMFGGVLTKEQIEEKKKALGL